MSVPPCRQGLCSVWFFPKLEGPAEKLEDEHRANRCWLVLSEQLDGSLEGFGSRLSFPGLIRTRLQLGVRDEGFLTASPLVRRIEWGMPSALTSSYSSPVFLLEGAMPTLSASFAELG